MRTQPHPYDHLAKAVAVTLTLALTLGCAIHKAQAAYDQGRYDDALAQYRQILRKDPGNVQARIGLRRTAPLAAEDHLIKAREAKKLGREALVRQEVATAVVLDPSNAVAVDWMNRLEEAAAKQRAAEEEEESVDTAKARAEAKAALPINPRSLEGMDLNFTKKTSLKEIFQQLSKNSGVNIILHSSASAQDPSISVDLRGLTFQRILDTLMLQSDLFYKVLDPNTLMVFKKTPQNLQDYENKLIQTFYLSNADVDGVRQIFNAIMPQMRVFIDKRLNAITVQAKTSDLAIATRIVNQLDKAKAEVMVYLELLEVSETDVENVGLLPTMNLADPNSNGLYRLGAVTSNVGASGLNQNTGGIRITKSNLNFLFAPLALDLLKTNGQGKLLASPNVRVVSGESGEVNIGQKISTTQSALGGAATPSTSSSTPASTALASLAGGAIPTQTSYSYEDVGVKIKVKPRVHFNGDITIELESEVKTQLPGSTPGRPDLGMRNIKTSARLRDGETAIFAGLLKEDETKSQQGPWGVSSIPILGSLLGHHNNSKQRVDVILTLRAVIVRKPNLGQEDFEAFDPDSGMGVNKPFAPRTGKKAMPSDFQDDTSMGPAQPAGKAPEAAKPAPAAESGKEPAPDAKGTAAEASPLVFFMSPMATEAPKGQHLSINLFASGAQGLTSGAMSLKVDPRLRVVAVTAGDLLTGEGGDLRQAPVKNGTINLTFTRKNGASDSGTLATLELEAMETGSATVQIQDGSYKLGTNPIPARYVNSLVTIQ